jgi:hypothetical protein
MLRRPALASSWAVVALLGVGLRSSACVQSAATDEYSAPPPVEPEPTAPACEVPPADALAIVETRACPVVLRSVDGGLILHSLDPQPTAGLRGVAPAVCASRPCDYETVQTSVGPLVWVTVRSADSEMPDGAWLGADVGERLRFVDLWEGAGDEMIVDGTRVGPAYALSPHDCGGALVLRAVPRVDDAGSTVPERLRDREGRPVADGTDGVVMEPAPTTECVAIESPIP